MRDKDVGRSARAGGDTNVLARPHGAAVYLRLKALSRGLVKKAGGQEAAAAITRTGHQTLSRYGQPDDPSYLPIDILADLETDVGEPVVTRALADIAGYILVARPTVAGGDPVWISRLSALARESGEAISALGKALEDGRITRAEAPDVRAEIRDAAEVLAAIDVALQAIEREGEA